jgi:hypothetical protein
MFLASSRSAVGYAVRTLISGEHASAPTFARLVWITTMEQVLMRLLDYQIDTENCRRYQSVGFFNDWESIAATLSPGSILEAELPG